MSHIIYFQVPQRHAKRVKDILDKRRLLDHAHKIQNENAICHIPTMIDLPEGERRQSLAQEAKATIARELGLCENTDEISWFAGTTRSKQSSQFPHKRTTTLMARAVNAWLDGFSSELLGSLKVSPHELLAALPEIHAQYHPLLILSKTAFTSDSWRKVVQGVELQLMQDLYKEITKAFQVTHLALNGLIPLIINGEDNLAGTVNILRSPSQFQPLYGDFGEMTSGPPTDIDFAQALWVSTKQNGIFQCWAPLYTMFSQGNVTEKQRLLNSLQGNSQEINPIESAAVDLYAGIGYFAFSYAMAGFKKVICWELNPWSVEGLRRGAAKNKWNVASIQRDRVDADDNGRLNLEGDENIIVFEEDNTYAVRRIHAMREQLPPVRHVNCGLLPSSRAVWHDAITILDPSLGGWIHVHENIANHERERREKEILESFRSYAGPRGVMSWQLRNVKSYAPGVTHCVMDLQISGG